jgi:catecholate siderophore receptor
MLKIKSRSVTNFELIAGVRDRFDLIRSNCYRTGSRVDENVQFRLRRGRSATLRVCLCQLYRKLPAAIRRSPRCYRLETQSWSRPTTHEIGAKWLIRLRIIPDRSDFRLDRSNSKAPDPATRAEHFLAGESRTEGAEISLVGNILPTGKQAWLHLLDGQLQTATSCRTAGTRLEQLPEHQISAWNRVQITDRFTTRAIHQDEQIASLAGGRIRHPYWRVDAAAFFDVSERPSIQLNVENLATRIITPARMAMTTSEPGAD